MVRLQNEDSLDQYITYVQRFAYYLLRVYIVQKEQGDSETNENSDEEIIDIENKDIINDKAKILGDNNNIVVGTQQQVINGIENNVMKDYYELTKLNTEQRE